MRISTNGS
jgi:hypothetical protein